MNEFDSLFDNGFNTIGCCIRIGDIGYARAVTVSREQSLEGKRHGLRGSMVSSRAALVMEMRDLMFLDRPSDAGVARARVAKEKKAKRVILTGENML